jgi:hypothetical protein
MNLQDMLAITTVGTFYTEWECFFVCSNVHAFFTRIGHIVCYLCSLKKNENDNPEKHKINGYLKWVANNPKTASLM